MSGFLAVFRRELRSLWVTPMAWVLLFVFVVLQGLSFYLVVDHFGRFAGSGINDGPIRGYFSSAFVPVSLLLVCPALSMRSFAEERRSGTIEPLLTAPVGAVAVTWGKYGGLLVTYVAMWLPTVLYVFILRDTGVVDWPAVAGAYLGVGLVGAAYLAVGLLMSAMTRSQLIAMLMTTLFIFGMLVLGVGERVFDPGILFELCRHVSVMSQLEEFASGVVDLRRVVFDVSLVSLCLFFCVRVVDSWRTA
jgi:ABC-2 type transport system permease protein